MRRAGLAIPGLLVLGLLVSGAPASAQVPPSAVTASVVMTVDRTSVQVGDRLRLQVRANVTGSDVTEVRVPDLSAFAIRSQQVSRPLQFRFGFGQQQQVVQATTVHTYVLEALTPGRFDLEPAEVEAAGRTFRSQPVSIVVGGAATPTQPPGQVPGQVDPSQQPGVDPGTQSTPAGAAVAVDGAQVDPQAFIRTVADEATPYVGQQVTVSVYLYTRAPIRSAPHVSREPSADGFWVHDLLPPQRALDPEIQTIQGTTYRVYLMRRFAAFPLREGALTIGAPTMTIQAGSLFDLFARGQELERTGVPIQIEARPLPDDAQGAVVGDYRIEARLDRTQVRTGDAVTLTATVSGVGNLRDVRLEPSAGAGVEFLQPEIQDRVEQPGDRVGGARSFEWLVIPQQPGTHTIEGLSLVVYDPATERARTLEAPELRIEAAGAAIVDPTPDPTPDPAEATEPAPAPTTSFTFGPIRTAAELAPASAPVSSRPWYWALLLAFPILGLSALLVSRLRRRPVDATKSVRKQTRKHLAAAESHASAGDARKFYGAITAALERTIEANTEASPRGLTHDELRQRLRDRGCDEDLVRRVIEELESCDFARFSSAGGSTQEMAACLGRARGLLGELERLGPAAPTEVAA